MDRKFIVTSSPHLLSTGSTRRIMLDVIIALLPAGIYGCVMFGLHAALLIVCSVATAVLSEFVIRKIMKRDTTVGDLSAVVTGLILAYNLPPELPVWMAIIGAFTAIVVVKQCFGGIGCNFANPAIAARIVLLVSFPVQMTTWLVDGVTSATPLAQIADGSLSLSGGVVKELLIGPSVGCIGEVGRLWLIIGGLYLIIRRVITPVIPLCFIGSVGVMSLICGANPVLQMLSGGLMLGAIFMATDYATSPINPLGKVIFGVGCGVLTVIIRLYCNLPEGVSYSILIMNILTPLIERATYPKPFGTPPKRGAAKEAAK